MLSASLNRTFPSFLYIIFIKYIFYSTYLLTCVLRISEQMKKLEEEEARDREAEEAAMSARNEQDGVDKEGNVFSGLSIS